MNLADMPTRVAIPFANGAGASYIRPVPVNSQIGVTPGAASFTDGFTPDTFTPLGGGGAYVNGEDMNGILNHATNWTRWATAGGPAVFNSAFAVALGGYPRGAVLVSNTMTGREWFNTVDGNVTDPDGAEPVGWVSAQPVAATLAQAEAGADATLYISPATLAGVLAAQEVVRAWSRPAGRAFGVTYTNTRNHEIEVSVWSQDGIANGFTMQGIVAGGVVAHVGTNYSTGWLYFSVPAGATYSVTSTNANPPGGWAELA